MKRLILVASLVCLAVVPGRAHAQTTTQVVGVYQAGWNMVGGPAGTDFSGAGYLYAWQNGAYVVPIDTHATLCTGYWAYFTDPAAIPLPPTATGPTQTCPLQVGWNLVGNPFAGVANMPTGATGYYWDSLSGSYQLVHSLQPGQSVWIYSGVVGSVTIMYSPAPPRSTPATLVISSLSGAGPYQIRVGDSVKLLVPSFLSVNATADPQYLVLETSGTILDLTCTTGNNCQTNPTATFWTWRAVAAGTANIMISPTCLLSTPPCSVPTQEIRINILP